MMVCRLGSRLLAGIWKKRWFCAPATPSSKRPTGIGAAHPFPDKPGEELARPNAGRPRPAHIATGRRHLLAPTIALVLSRPRPHPLICALPPTSVRWRLMRARSPRGRADFTAQCDCPHIEQPPRYGNRRAAPRLFRPAPGVVCVCRSALGDARACQHSRPIEGKA